MEMDDKHSDQSAEARQQRLHENRRRLDEIRLRREQVTQQQEEINREREEATRQRLDHFRAIRAERGVVPNQQSDEFWRQWKQTEANLEAKHRAEYEERNRPYQEERRRLEALKHQKREERQRLLERLYPMLQELHEKPASTSKISAQVRDASALTESELEALVAELEAMIHKPWNPPYA